MVFLGLIQHMQVQGLLSSWVKPGAMDMAVSAIPILLVVPLFDILMYFNILPMWWYWLGFSKSRVNQSSNHGIEMMFLGNKKH